MHIVDVFYNKYYLPTVINRISLKKRNKNKSFSLLTANCMAGYIYHQLDVNFQSPTINLMMLQTDFYKFISNLKYYLSLDFLEVENQGGCPVGRLDDITVYFTHYQTFEAGVSAWKRRTARIDFDNLYIIASDRDGVTDEDIESLGKIKCKKLICFTAKKYELSYCFQVKEFIDEECIGNILGKTLSGKWKFERFFDYIGWLNSDNTEAEAFRIGKR